MPASILHALTGTQCWTCRSESTCQSLHQGLQLPFVAFFADVSLADVCRVVLRHEEDPERPVLAATGSQSTPGGSFVLATGKLATTPFDSVCRGTLKISNQFLDFVASARGVIYANLLRSNHNEPRL